MKEKGLPMVGTRVQQILAILDSGGLRPDLRLKHRDLKEAN